ncbi:hypothetical protein DER44DRAFT_438486 [Fusarium oxysporum]|nr:hypothetical protein DER44DRAFT_438486 [Fusarium oxysporum]
MDFIEGVSVDNILQNSNARIMRQEVSERVIEAIFRQMMNFSLQLQKFDFSRIGSLSSKSEAGSGGFTATFYSRPMTKKSHDFLLVEIEERYRIALKGNSQDLDSFLSDNRRLLALDSSRYQWQSWACFNRRYLSRTGKNEPATERSS